MRLMPHRSLLVPMLLVAACGYTDPGGGSDTLEVVAEATYHTDRNETDLRVSVDKNDDAVTGAKVIFQDGDTDESWSLDEHAGGEFPYRLDVEGYHRRLELRVVSGSDKLRARLEGPGPHVILEPKHGDIIDREELGKKLEVHWEVKDGIAAELVRVTLDEGDSDNTTDDDGDFEINASSLADGSEGIHVIRSNVVDLAGGVGRSSFTIFYDAHNTFTVE